MTKPTYLNHLFLPPGTYFLPPKFKPFLSKYERWRKVGKIFKLSKEALLRLEWIIYYYTKAQRNVSLTCRHFGIVRKTFYHWFNRFDEANLRTLEEKSRAPLRRRQREYTPLQYERIVVLRKAHIRYGKAKLLELYRRDYPEDIDISLWKIQCIIVKANLYYHPQKQARINRKRVCSVKRKKITDLKKKKVRGFLLCFDTIVQYWMGKKRYIVTGIDRYSKIAFARMYSTHSSSSARDFLYRMHYLLEGKITNVQTDNGSEFKKHFSQGLKQLKLEHYHSRIKTPKDNPVIERFNRTLQEEFINLGNMTADTKEFNRRLLNWLIEYNFRRPHQTLDYMPPANFHFKYHKVLPMYSSSTMA